MYEQDIKIARMQRTYMILAQARHIHTPNRVVNTNPQKGWRESGRIRSVLPETTKATQQSVLLDTN